MRRIAFVGVLAGCGVAVDADPPADDPEVPADTPEAPDPRLPLDPVARAVRASMALRGVRPTAEELDRVRADADALPGLVATWAEDPAVGGMVKELYAEVLSMRSVDLVYPQLGTMLAATQQELRDALAEEPLRLVEHVVREDLPFSTIVTADVAFFDRTAAGVWSGHDYDPDGPEVQAVRFTDGRPAAGLLTSNGLWARHPSAGANHHRGRANVIARALLCEDFVARDVPISGDVDLSDDAAVADAVRTNADCVSCHQALDPLAAHLWVFHPEYTPGAAGLAQITGCNVPFLELCYPFDPYRPVYDLGRLLLGLRPLGYYGQPTEGLRDLGEAIADDPRFASCAVRRAWSYLAEVPLDDVPFVPAAELQRRFRASGLSYRSLLVDLVLHPDFGAAGVDPEVPGADAVAPRVPGPLVVRPWQHAALVHQLTGFRWEAAVDNLVCTVGGLFCYGDVDLSADDQHGFRAMAGGVDGARVLAPTHTFTPVKLLFAAALAEEAAGHVVDADFERPADERRLLRLVEADTVPANDEAAVRAQLAALSATILLEPLDPDGPEVDALLDLWTATATRRTADGWKGVIATLLQDPRVLTY